ncbi:hypothetical protein LCGC14_1778010 [marine sediment metagenome]|uniref:Uncharacterized protein n=1 Tax=marine sediment metagenome TaxID=412755 RepID=A0A0F9JVW1_9ZZZZ
MANGIKIDKDAFKEGDAPFQRSALFDGIKNMNDTLTVHIEKDDKRMKKLENRKLQDKGFAGAMGLIGGFIAGLFK